MVAPGDYLESFADLGKLLAYLWNDKLHTHVVIDPRRGLQSAVAKLDDFIHWLELSNPEYTGPKYFRPFPELTPFDAQNCGRKFACSCKINE